MKKNTTSAVSPSILVIDDEESICEFFVYVFDEFNIKIDTERTGAAGLECAMKNSYSLIFLDVQLGDMSGLDVLKKIKAHNLNAKVVIISGYLTESLIKEALELGADKYLFKPLVVRDIVSLTHRFIDPVALMNQTEGNRKSNH